MIALQPAPAEMADGVRAYAVGDVHGCLDRLRALHGLIADDIAARPPRSAVLIHLGDYVDRGPDSAGVLRYLQSGALPAPSVNLLGNHEAMMLDAVLGRGPSAVPHWMMNGGDATLASFGLADALDPASWQAALSPEPLGFLQGLKLTHRMGGYVFVHAGVRPGVRLKRQARHDLLWIRDEFLLSSGTFEGVVVHGHTPTRAPEVRWNRIGIDTGAVMGGALTCAVLEGRTLGFLSA